MSVSIKDIAQKANVSPSTVSRALNNHPRISDDTKKQIHALAKEMGYVPSGIARALVGKRSATIGVAIADFLDPFYSDIIAGIEDIAVANNYHIFVSSFYRDKQRERTLLNAFYERRLAGIIVAGSVMDNEYLSFPHRKLMPAVLINCPRHPFSVSADKSLGARLAVEHLIDLGHRRIAHVRHAHDYETAQLRLTSYKETLKQHGIPLDDRYIVAGDERFTGGVRAVDQLLALPEPPTAVFCFNDMTAIGVINALLKKGIDVPNDISVVGFDDLDIASFYHPALTTVHQPTYQIGRESAKMLSAIIEGNKNIEAQLIEPKLIVRESTAPLRAK
ncbi:hypothetical protein MNBD_CHLOROFLEXI01-4299 [hydrothermal vent metagenome]|uniref:HTH lacI-type domain-containing protein n=1 Tax=hydrothermal vent metagenome TaxID=652676 RepID=A0A3B0UTB1_9ZZZZ